MVFQAKAKTDGARKKEVTRAVLLIDWLNEKPPADLAKKVALGRMVSKIPADIRLEAVQEVGAGGQGVGTAVADEEPGRVAEQNMRVMSAEGVAQQLEETFQEVLSESDTMSELAQEMDMSEAELAELMKDPEFKSMVAEELAAE